MWRVAGLWMLVALAVLAQDSWDNLSKLRQGDRIRVVRTDMTAVEGAFRGSTADEVAVDSSAIRRGDVVRITRMKHGRVRNVAIMTAIGAGAGLGVAAALLGATGGSDETARIMVTGLGIGAGMGAAAGAAIPPGTTVYRSPRDVKR